MIKRILCFAIIVITAFGCFACGSKTVPDSDYVKIEMESGGVFYIELYPAQAPETVANFKKLVSEGFYNGLTFTGSRRAFLFRAVTLWETVTAGPIKR